MTITYPSSPAWLEQGLPLQLSEDSNPATHAIALLQLSSTLSDDDEIIINGTTLTAKTSPVDPGHFDVSEGTFGLAEAILRQSELRDDYYVRIISADTLLLVAIRTGTLYIVDETDLINSTGLDSYLLLGGDEPLWPYENAQYAITTFADHTALFSQAALQDLSQQLPPLPITLKQPARPASIVSLPLAHKMPHLSRYFLPINPNSYLLKPALAYSCQVSLWHDSPRQPEAITLSSGFRLALQGQGLFPVNNYLPRPSLPQLPLLHEEGQRFLYQHSQFVTLAFLLSAETSLYPAANTTVQLQTLAITENGEEITATISSINASSNNGLHCPMTWFVNALSTLSLKTLAVQLRNASSIFLPAQNAQWDVLPNTGLPVQHVACINSFHVAEIVPLAGTHRLYSTKGRLQYWELHSGLLNEEQAHWASTLLLSKRIYFMRISSNQGQYIPITLLTLELQPTLPRQAVSLKMTYNLDPSQTLAQHELTF